MVSEDVEFRNPAGGRSLRGRAGLERIVDAAADARVTIVRRRQEEVSIQDGVVRIAMPVVELAGGSAIHGTAEFEVRDGKISAFEGQLRAAPTVRLRVAASRV